MGLALACRGLEKEVSLVTGEPIGELAVAGKLLIDLHAEFMVSRTPLKNTALNWYNCGLSGGGRITEVGGNFGDFGLHVPHTERDKRYPRAATVGDVPAVSFDGNDIMKGNFAIEAPAAGDEDMAIEVWVQDDNAIAGEVVLGWQSADGRQTSAALTYPESFKGSEKPIHVVVNCTAGKETWVLDGKEVSSGPRRLRIAEGHMPVLGGPSAGKPSFQGSLVTLRLHSEAMTAEEIVHNFKGGPMLGTKLHAWWRLEGPEKWRTDESKHFRNCVSVKEMEDWSEKQLENFEARLPRMFELAEEIYHLYSENLAMRSSVVSNKREFRGDGIKYKIPNQPSKGSWMGWDGKRGFGWGCQGAGHINPHELVHGFQGMTGGTMQGNYWEAHANFPQTYAGIYQTVPPNCCSRVSMFFPANGRCYYHARLMFEHLAQTPEYGPMFISKLWYDGGTRENKNEYPWTAFTKLDPDPSTPLAYEWTRMVQKCVTWDFEIYGDKPDDLYRADAERNKAEMLRYGRVTLERIPYDTIWWRPPKEMTPQQLAYNICPLKAPGGRAAAILQGHVSKERGSDWRAAFVGVTAEGTPVYGDIGGAGDTVTLDTAGTKELYLVVCATPTKVMPIKMTGDFRSLEQEKFPYRVKLTGCEPLDALVPEKPDVAGAAHPNGGGFVAAAAEVESSAYVGPDAQVLGKSRVLGQARIEDYAVVRDATVRGNAIVSGHALVENRAVVQDYAKVRDWGRVRGGAVVEDYAKVVEHGTMEGKPCGGFAVIKGVAWSSGPVRGSAMLDGSYRKSNDIDKGKWFTWSWSKGKNPGEVDEELGGLYMQMTFNNPHEWMARDDFGATWGYLVGAPEVTGGTDGILVLNGRDQFVELQRDVADMRDVSIKAAVCSRGTGDARILDFSNARGDCVYLGIAGGKCVFAIMVNGKTQSLEGPPLEAGRPTEILVILSGNTGKLFLDGEEAARNDAMTLNPDDVEATACYLGRGRDGAFFRGEIDNLEIYSVPLADEVAPSPDPARFASLPVFANPTKVTMQAVAGVDPLGRVEYFFEETSGNPGGDDSGWTEAAVYEDSGLDNGLRYAYRVKMRDACGNVTKPSAEAAATWEQAEAFRSADGKTIVIEAESFTRSVAGAGSAEGIEWKLSPQRDGCAGKGMMAALPDRGVQVDSGLERQCPRLDYLVDFPARGKYSVWMRTWGRNPNSDSVYAGLDMQTSDRSLFHMGFGKLQWQRHRDWSFDVDSAGLHTLNVWMREDGCAFDRMVLTLDRRMRAPDGEGPPESSRRL